MAGNSVRRDIQEGFPRCTGIPLHTSNLTDMGPDQRSAEVCPLPVISPYFVDRQAGRATISKFHLTKKISKRMKTSQCQATEPVQYCSVVLALPCPRSHGKLPHQAQEDGSQLPATGHGAQGTIGPVVLHASCALLSGWCLVLAAGSWDARAPQEAHAAAQCVL